MSKTKKAPKNRRRKGSDAARDSANEGGLPSLAEKLLVVGQICQRIASELATLDDEVMRAPQNGDARERRDWRANQVEDLLTRVGSSKLLNAEAFTSIRGKLLDADHAQLVAGGATAADAKEQLRRLYGYEESQPTAVRDALTDYRRIRAGKAPLNPRTRRPPQPKPPPKG